ncbi:hypothetical protein L1785_04750 [Antribacter sp. KLBMP9083]|uniref:Uncharacterized protein n=1 Tax=Antribacter soli TaxID=2910976 RepID=A0AA41U5R1_9MICO|nr:hypothetical protein [Antribacter soli]MCF4120283.1 hypothetical protein [Antribacter soli]
MPGDELLPPVGYSGWWTVLGVALLLVAVALVVLPLWFTRRSKQEMEAERHAPAPSGRRGRTDPWDALRKEYTARLDEIERRYERDELDSRALHQELAREMRRFAATRLGRPVETLTLTQIAELQDARRLTDLITRCYAPEFADPHNRDAFGLRARTSVHQAREAVREW